MWASRSWGTLDDIGIKGLGWMEYGMRNINSVRPIEKPEDLQGIKIRTMENPIHRLPAFHPMWVLNFSLSAGMGDPAQENPVRHHLHARHDRARLPAAPLMVSKAAL